MTATTARLLQAIERLTDALERTAAAAGDTVDVKGAAKLLRTTPRAIYVRHQRGQMPRPIRGAKRLLWRKADVIGR